MVFEQCIEYEYEYWHDHDHVQALLDPEACQVRVLRLDKYNCEHESSNLIHNLRVHIPYDIHSFNIHTTCTSDSQKLVQSVPAEEVRAQTPLVMPAYIT